MRLLVPEPGLAIGGDVALMLPLVCSALGVPLVALARLGQPLMVAEASGATGNAAAPRLFQWAAGLRQSCAITDLNAVPAHRGTRIAAEGPPLRFFASVPLLCPTEGFLGALCIADTVPRLLTRRERAQLEDAARVLMRLLGAVHGSEATQHLGAELLRAEEAARAHAAAEQRYRKMYERASALAKIGVWEYHFASGRLSWTDGVYDIFDLPRGGAVTREQILRMYFRSSRVAMERARRRAIETGTGFSLDIRIRSARGVAKWVRLSAEVEMERGLPHRIFGLKQDITHEREMFDQLRRHAERDSLTGLANRAMFEQVLAAVAHKPHALLLADLDGFKAVNDTFGHAVGDACLVAIAARLRQVFRKAELIARIGGDEFAVVVTSPPLLGEIESCADAAVAAIGSPIPHAGQVFTVGASIGVAHAGRDDASGLFGRADRALYAAKNGGRNQVRTCTGA